MPRGKGWILQYSENGGNFDVSPLWLISGMTGWEKDETTKRQAAMIISEDGMSYRNSDSCLYYEVTSDEMSPTLEVGDTAVIDRKVNSFDQTGIYLVTVSDATILRRFRRTMDGSIQASCDNTNKYPGVETVNAEYAEHLTIIGRVLSKVSVARVS